MSYNLVKQEGPVKAQFEVVLRGHPVTLEVVLDGIELTVETEYSEMDVSELVDMPMVCFGPDRVKSMTLQKTIVRPDETGRYGKVKTRG